MFFRVHRNRDATQIDLDVRDPADVAAGLISNHFSDDDWWGVGEQIQARGSYIEEQLHATAHLSATTAHMVRMKHYQTIVGLCDHPAEQQKGNKARPFSLVAWRPQEDYLSVSRMLVEAQAFAELKIYERFGVSWPEFLAMPRRDALLMLAAAKRTSDALNAALSKPPK